jgi:hypothetical protein
MGTRRGSARPLDCPLAHLLPAYWRKRLLASVLEIRGSIHREFIVACQCGGDVGGEADSAFCKFWLQRSGSMSQRCLNCGTQAPEGAKFCASCGHSISQEVYLLPHSQWRNGSYRNPKQIDSSPSIRSSLERWGGLAAILAGILLLSALPLASTPLVREDVRLVVVPLVVATGTLLMAIALPGLQTRQAGRSGRLGRAGVTMAVFGVGTFIPSLVIFAFIAWRGIGVPLYFALGPPAWLLWLGGAGGVLLLVGLAVFGIVTARANVLPRWAAVMFAAGLPLGLAI